MMWRILKVGPFPVPRPKALYGAKPSEAELAERDDAVPPYFPSIHPPSKVPPPPLAFHEARTTAGGEGGEPGSPGEGRGGRPRHRPRPPPLPKGPLDDGAGGGARGGGALPGLGRLQRRPRLRPILLLPVQLVSWLVSQIREVTPPPPVIKIKMPEPPTVPPPPPFLPATFPTPREPTPQPPLDKIKSHIPSQAAPSQQT